MVNGLAHLEISGAPLARGQQYGEGLRVLIGERDRRWKSEIGETTGQLPRLFIDEFLSGAKFVPAVMRLAPDLMDEVRGIADGAHLEFQDVLAAQFMDEEWWFAEVCRGRRHHCSSFGWVDSENRTALVGQTMDLPNWMDGFQTLLTIHAQETGRSAQVLTVAGMIGLCGVNDAGLGLAVNTLSDLAPSPSGLPVAFVARSILACPDHDAAFDLVKSLPHASGQNYVIADRRRISALECSANAVAPYRPNAAPANIVWHANHALANDESRSGGALHHPSADKPNSRARMAALQRLFAGDRPLDMKTAQSALVDRTDARYPICRHLDPHAHRDERFFTFASVIWDIGASVGALVAPGPLDQVGFKRFLFGREPSSIAAD